VGAAGEASPAGRGGCNDYPEAGKSCTGSRGPLLPEAENSLRIRFARITIRPMRKGRHLVPRLAAGALLLAVVTGCTTRRFAEPTREQVLEAILPSSVQVVLERDGIRFRSASGVVIAARPSAQGSECFVLTSGHTVNRLSGLEEIYVLFDRHRGAGTKVPATVLAERETDRLDLALLRAQTARCFAARPGLRPPALGEAIWVIAFPWGRNMTLVSGIVSQINPNGPGDKGLPPKLMVDASVSYGASGGGVYEMRTGSLIGLVEGYGTARVTLGDATSPRYISVPVPGETYVIPLASIRQFLDEAGYAGLLGGAARGQTARR